MDHLLNQIFSGFEECIGNYAAIEEDFTVSDGNVAVCILDEEGNVYGRIFGEDKIKGRQFYEIAWKKASQVWITSKDTGEFEKLVFSGELDHKDFGIKKHDYVGWYGGKSVEIGEHKIAIAFSGFREFTDLKIVEKVIQRLKL